MAKTSTSANDDDDLTPELAAIFSQVQAQTPGAYAEFVGRLGEALAEAAGRKDYCRISMMREHCRQLFKALGNDAPQQTVLYLAESDALLYAMAMGRWRETAQIARALGELLAGYGPAEQSKELMLRLHYLAGLPWQEITQLDGAKEKIGDPISAAAALGEDLQRVGLSHEMLRRQYLQPKGKVTLELADVRDGKRILGEVVARDRAKLQRFAGHLLRSENTASWQATDLVNEMFVRLPREAERAPVNQREMSKLTRRIMQNILIDRARKHVPGRGRYRGDMPEDPASEEKRVDQALMEKQVMAATREVLDKLRKSDPLTAGILEAALYRSTEQKEIARLHSVSVATVKRRLQDAKAQIRQRLGIEPENGRQSNQQTNG